jgi:hypothetical protein
MESERGIYNRYEGVVIIGILAYWVFDYEAWA